MNNSNSIKNKNQAKAIKNGNFEAFNEVYSEYYPKLVNYIYKLSKDRDLTEDMVQETFFILWEKRKSIKIELSIGGYLFKICYNEFLKNLRRQSKERAFLDEVKATQYLQIFSTEENNEQIILVKKIIENLSPKCKEAFIASKFENLSYAEIAQRMGISKKTVELHISKAYSVLRTKLKVMVTLFF